jgi:hypothetical protein
MHNARANPMSISRAVRTGKALLDRSAEVTEVIGDGTTDDSATDDDDACAIRNGFCWRRNILC